MVALLKCSTAKEKDEMMTAPPKAGQFEEIGNHLGRSFESHHKITGFLDRRSEKPRSLAAGHASCPSQ